ncbi:MAG: DUF5946 family protein [Coriobacteriia bacterium]
MSDRCPECGAPVADGGTCRDNFTELLALEWEVPQGAGTMAHFYAVSSYVLQHPGTMNYTAESLAWLRTAVHDALTGDVQVPDLRDRAAEESKADGTITRRPGEPVPLWDVGTWTMTVTDVLAAGASGYGERVRMWAHTALSDLDKAGE